MRKGRTAFTGALLCLAVVAVYNVISDNADVVALAETAACGTPKCALSKVKEFRQPFGQSFTFQTSMKPQTLVDIDCHRGYVLVGTYACKRE
jgi:hypothetical protein